MRIISALTRLRKKKITDKGNDGLFGMKFILTDNPILRYRADVKLPKFSIRTEV